MSKIVYYTHSHKEFKKDNWILYITAELSITNLPQDNFLNLTST